MKISEIRKAVIDKLENEIRDLKIEPFPNNPRDFRLLHPNGAVLIAFDGLNPSEPRTQQQFYTLTMKATVLFRSTIDSENMLNKLDLIRQSVTNDLYPYGSRFYCVSQVPLGEEDHVWYYRITFVLPGIMMQGD